MAGSLRDKTIEGVGWNTLNTILKKCISFLVTIVLARLVTPEEYGLIGLVGVVSVLIGGFIDCGLGSALVRKTNATEDDYNTVFVMNMAMSVVVFAIVFITAPFVASFFNQPRLTALTRVAAIGLIVGTIGNVQSLQLTKRLDFKTPTKISFISCVVSGIIGIVMAALGFGAWALLGQSLSATFISTLLVCIYNRWAPKFYFSRDSFKELFGFGSKLLLASLLEKLWGQINNIVIGRFYNPATLGQYNRGHTYAELFSSNLIGIVQGVSYPSLSLIQDDVERLKQAYRKIIKITMLTSLCCMLGLAAVAKPIVFILIGDQWAQAADFLTIMCFSMAIFPLTALNLNMLQVQGRSGLILKLDIITKTISIIPIVMGALVSIWAMLWTELIVTPLIYYVNSYYSGRLINYSIMEQVHDILPSILITTLMFAIVYPMSLLDIPYLLMLMLQVLCGVILVFVLCEVTKLEEWAEIKTIAKDYFLKFKMKISANHDS